MTAYIFPGIKDIDDAVSQVWGIDKELLKKRTRDGEIVIPRQVAMWWRKNNTKESLSIIGRRYGSFDHATVLYAVKTVNNIMDVDKNFREMVNRASGMMPAKVIATNNKKENRNEQVLFP